MSEIDPGHSTSQDINRRTFVGLSGGMIAAAAATGPASAGGSPLGKPHLPLVREDDPRIRVARVTLPSLGGSVAAYTASPVDAKADAPGIVVTMHIWGVDESIRDVVRRYAVEGYVTVAPDLYTRQHAPAGDGATDYVPFVAFAKALVPAQVDADLDAAASWIVAGHPKAKIGLTGFCMGGAIALRQALRRPLAFVADAPFYGKVEGLDPAAIRIPICGSYGELDTGIPADGVRAFAKALKVPSDIVEYPSAGHAFFDDQRASYVPDAASDAWRRTLAFFAKYLRG
ncbi:MAG: dienelactone hydrolase family protein [Candidatus Eremiobacteraeota bacterium]|nr:dienelactone hydrolase family protein [Candidatus Eremiobacteraeota bacterium]